ncbi:MAG: nucleotidyltransferase domain-containing protein [Verrucomicrobia bacterium]|nr:nucleotidyltransferase domain-containing protein [Verrucomicrobiota bacterium]
MLRACRCTPECGSFSSVRLLLERLPASLRDQCETLARCLEVMHRAVPLTAVYLFGSHARGQPRPDSAVDLCLVAEGAADRLKAAQRFREADLGHLALPSLDADSHHATTTRGEKCHGRSFRRHDSEGGSAAC